MCDQITRDNVCFTCDKEPSPELVDAAESRKKDRIRWMSGDTRCVLYSDKYNEYPNFKKFQDWRSPREAASRLRASKRPQEGADGDGTDR